MQPLFSKSMTTKSNHIDIITQKLRKAGIFCHDQDLIIQAFIHSTYSNEKELPHNNERLEFLGDSVLNLVVSEELYRRFPDVTEAELSRMKGYLVSNDVLAMVCENMGINKFLLMGKGEIKQNGTQNRRNLACLFEALLGAIFLDQGLEGARKCVLTFVFEEHVKESEIDNYTNCKGALQEISVRQYHELPRYTVLEKSGEEHDPYYKVRVSINKRNYGYGCSSSIKKAQKEAAYMALKRIRKEENERTSLHEK